jgi:uncharacterized Fe-S center protein
MPSIVFFAELPDGASPREQARAMGRLYEEAGVSRIISRRDLVAIKLHVGEKGNKTYVKPELISELVKRVKASRAFPFLTDTCTLYRGQRENAIKHILLAHGHGFSIEKVGAPFIVADGLVGTTEMEVEIPGRMYQRVGVAREILNADALIAVSHPTGHPGTGMAACLKNLGMGLASRAGKMRQHSAIRPEVQEARCQNCGKCRRWCPHQAIVEKNGKSFILPERCIGCGECIALCRFDAVSFDFGIECAELQRRMVEHALGVLRGKEGKCFFFNVLVDMTKDCDCLGEAQRKIVPDMGILASQDPVALDKATLDLVKDRRGFNLGELSYPELNPMVQILYAQELGMGSTEYILERIEVEAKMPAST